VGLLVHTASRAPASPSRSRAATTPSKGRLSSAMRGPIAGDEAVEEAGQGRLRRASRHGGEAALDEATRAPLPIIGRAWGQGQRRDTLFGQEGVEHAHQVGRGVDEGAVEVEDDGGAGESGVSAGQACRSLFSGIETLRRFR